MTLKQDRSVQLTLQPDNNMEGVTRLRHQFDSMLTKQDLHSKTFERSVYLYKGMDINATGPPSRYRPVRSRPGHLRLDVDCKAHDVDNLYVVDGASMPSIGAVNPTLTIIANAIRVADRIADRLKG